MAISNEDLVKLVDLKFSERYSLYKLQYESFHQFIEDIIFKKLKKNEYIFYDSTSENILYRYRFVYDNIALKPPTIDKEDKYMFPEDARRKHLTYSSKLTASVKQIQEVINITTDEKTINIIGEEEHNVPIANIPIMVRSKYCTTNILKNEKNTECIFDPDAILLSMVMKKL